MVITTDDYGMLAICALRYCQGRMSYMPKAVRDIVRPQLKKLSDHDIQVMINDCETQAKLNDYGDERIDKPGWLKWTEELKAEKERRERRKKKT